jgi:mannonate dehydratase
MIIDLAHPNCIPFFHAMVALGMTLLCHTGEEHSVDMCGLDNELGNPLRLRHALNAGVTVIAAHCATEGVANDLDQTANTNGKYPKAECFHLFLRLMDESQYHGQLFGDISAILAFRRIGYTATLLDRTDLHHRLVNGSDYPVPALNIVVHTRKLVSYGLITSAQRNVLNEIYRENPLLFDFCTKRALISPAGNQFPPSVFKANPAMWNREHRNDDSVSTGEIKVEV